MDAGIPEAAQPKLRVSAAVLAFLVAFVVGTALAACGGSSASKPDAGGATVTTQLQSPTALTAAASAVDPTSARVTKDDALAESMLLAASDFPNGWVHEPTDSSYDPQAPFPGAPDAMKKCFTGAFPGQTGRAIGGEWSNSRTTMLSINPSVYVFDNPEDAQRAAQQTMTNAQCMADSIGDGLDVDATFSYGKSYTTQLAANEFGATLAIRFFNTQVHKDQSPERSDVLVFDIVVTVRGRILYQVEGFQRYAPIDQALLGQYVRKAQAKIQAQ